MLWFFPNAHIFLLYHSFFFAHQPFGSKIRANSHTSENVLKFSHTTTKIAYQHIKPKLKTREKSNQTYQINYSNPHCNDRKCLFTNLSFIDTKNVINLNVHTIVDPHIMLARFFVALPFFSSSINKTATWIELYKGKKRKRKQKKQLQLKWREKRKRQREEKE